METTEELPVDLCGGIDLNGARGHETDLGGLTTAGRMTEPSGIQVLCSEIHSLIVLRSHVLWAVPAPESGRNTTADPFLGDRGLLYVTTLVGSRALSDSLLSLP